MYVIAKFDLDFNTPNHIVPTPLVNKGYLLLMDGKLNFVSDLKEASLFGPSEVESMYFKLIRDFPETYKMFAVSANNQLTPYSLFGWH